MGYQIALLPGDGVGPDVIDQSKRVLEAVATKFAHDFQFSKYRIGGDAIDACGSPLTDETLNSCKKCNAILLGAVGGPKWAKLEKAVRPEAGLLRLRKELSLFTNLRPIRPSRHLLDTTPFKPDLIADVDILFVRELTSGIYFGETGRRWTSSGVLEAFDEMSYNVTEIERIVRVAAGHALNRQNKLTIVDKANVLSVSQLWREVTNRVLPDYPSLEHEFVYVDAMAMFLLTKPQEFDVVVTSNLFGDILTDEASVLCGAIGMSPSASLGESGPELYEPIHGSAPDIAGQGIANPLAAILSSAMLLRHSLKLEREACAVEESVEKVLSDGNRTADITTPGKKLVSTEEMGALVVQAIA